MDTKKLHFAVLCVRSMVRGRERPRKRRIETAEDDCRRMSQLPKLCVKISILRHRRMSVRYFSTRLTSVTFAEDKVLIFLILCKNAKVVQL